MFSKWKKHKRKNDEGLSRQMTMNQGRQVQFYNFWQQPLDEMYWSRWFKARPELLGNKPNLKVGMFSVFGDRNVINHTDCDVNIFYSAENLKNESYWNYADAFLNEPRIDLSIGFEYFEHERYCRFPNWMDVFFLTQKDISPMCEKLRFPDVSQKQHFAALVCSHDGGGLRTSILNALEGIAEVSCPGKFRHNDDSLLQHFNDDKMAYLKQFCFNICPENTNAMGYVTEKLFQSISAGCIPVYWGSFNRPELDVLNQDAIVFWRRDGDNTSSIKLIEDLVRSPKLMKEFLCQPRLLPSAEEYISDAMLKIEHRIKTIIESK